MAKKLGIAVLSFLLLMSVMPWAVAEQSCIVDVLCVDDNHQPISGVVVEALRENNGTWQQETTNNDGKAYFEMENGHYSLTVNTAPDGYRAAQEKYQVLVKAGTPYLSNDSFSRTYDYETITFVNEAESLKEPQRSFMVYAADDADNPLASAKLTLQSKSKTYVTTTDEDGLATFLAIDGRYTLSETEVPIGYKASKTTYTIVLNNEGVFLDEENSLKAYNPVTFVSPALADELNTEVLYSVSAYVKSIDGKFLEGATLTLTSTENTYSKFTNKQGMAEFKVPAGKYVLKQTGGTEFFDPISDTYNITVTDEGMFFTDSGEDYKAVTFINSLKASSISPTTPESLIKNRQKLTDNQTDSKYPISLITDQHMAYLSGYTDGSFGCSRNITRAEVAVMFVQLLDKPLDSSQVYTSSFTDVAEGYWYSQAIGYLEQWELIKGYADGSFRPNAAMTRAEFISLISEFTDSVVAESNIFTDVPNEHWAAKAINSAAQQGFVSGYTDGSFLPNANITRAEAVTIMNNVLNREADVDYITQNQLANSFTDCQPGYWAYYEIMEATNSHEFKLENGREVWF